MSETPKSQKRVRNPLVRPLTIHEATDNPNSLFIRNARGLIVFDMSDYENAYESDAVTLRELVDYFNGTSSERQEGP